ncbi:PDZ domain containing protein [Ditylenchus destructor]|uniref:PDZ domain containing protein n=1 Tax=Ditylenchus destructor TaxID=166010 RepID=A0AAD4N3I5_9BILA|nr:PDZ domain containing protein [Ditylenchus destructor]
MTDKANDKTLQPNVDEEIVELEMEENDWLGATVNEKLIVTKVQPMTLAEGKLKEGYRIVKINNEPVKDRDHFYELLRAATAPTATITTKVNFTLVLPSGLSNESDSSSEKRKKTNKTVDQAEQLRLPPISTPSDRTDEINHLKSLLKEYREKNAQIKQAIASLKTRAEKQQAKLDEFNRRLSKKITK